MFGGAPIADTPVSSMVFTTPYTGAGPCNIFTTHQMAGTVSVEVFKSTNIQTSVNPAAIITYTILGG